MYTMLYVVFQYVSKVLESGIYRRDYGTHQEQVKIDESPGEKCRLNIKLLLNGWIEKCKLQNLNKISIIQPGDNL